MKKLWSILLVAVFVATTTLVPQRAEALVGSIFANKTVKTIGAVGAVGGGTITATGVIGVAMTSGSMNALGWAVVAVGGFWIAGLGLIVLDDNTLLDIEFQPILSLREGIDATQEEIDIYNSELPLLNMIRKTIVVETDEAENTNDAEKRWIEYASYLHPATFHVAQELGKEFLRR